MKRFFTSRDPAEGAVFRDIEGCGAPEASSAECAVCLDYAGVTPISPPGCSDFPVTDNNYGALPAFFGGDVEIDTYEYDDRWNAVDPYPSQNPVCPTPPQAFAYPDLWTLIGSEASLTAFQSDVLDADCFCQGEGIDRAGLTLGRPQFPSVSPLPFFTIPSFGLFQLRVRELNPDGADLPGDCCPNNEDDLEYIQAEIVNNEIRLTRHKKEDLERKYRADDTDISFQLRAGFPKECCIRDDCPEASSGGSSGEEQGFVIRTLHFPRWPGPNSIVSEGTEARNPYAEGSGSAREEPLGIIPRVIDIQCGPDGKLYVYYANDIIHNGDIAGLIWDAGPPRGSAFDATAAPDPPESLPFNTQYDGSPIIPAFDPIGELCDKNCNAAINIIKPDAACSPECFPAALVCDLSVEYGAEVTATGVTAAEAENNAFESAESDAPSGCDATEYFLCYSVYDEDLELYVAAVQFCCPL